MVTPSATDADHGAPLTDLQHAYWVGEQGAYDLSVPARLRLDLELPELDETALRRALDACSARHPMLRARVRPDGTQSVDAGTPIPLLIRDITTPPAAGAPATVPVAPEAVAPAQGAPTATATAPGPTAAAAPAPAPTAAAAPAPGPDTRWRIVRDEALDALPSLADGPPLAAVAVRMPGAVRLTLVLRLFVFDAASVGILLRDLGSFYRDPALRLPPVEESFLDFARREERRAGRARREAEAYWAARLAELPGPPELPLAAGAPPAGSTSFRRHGWMMSAERSARLRARARARGLSVNAVMCSAYAAVLARFCGRDSFTLTVLASRRPATARHADVIGNHGTTVALAVPAAPGASFGERTRRLQERLHEAYGHSAVSGIEVLRRMKARGGNSPELLPVVFAGSIGSPGGDTAPEQEEPPAADGLPGARPLGGALHTPQVWIDHQVHEDGPAIGCTVDLVEDVFPEGLPDAFIDTYRQWLDLLTDAEDHWDEPVRPRLPGRLLAARRAANSTTRPLPARLLHDGFDEQRRLRPERTALICGTEHVSYGRLGTEAISLARRLTAEGVRPGDLVAVRAAKSRPQIAAVLAVLYAGGAYVPLAPSVPPRRLAKVIRHAGIRLVLTDDPGGLAADPDVPVVDLRTTGTAPGPDAAVAPVHRSLPSDLAYIIYTSGTSGEPKGVAIEHRAAMNTIDDLLDRFAIGPGDRTLQLSSLGFDLSVFDVFGTLAAGGTLVLPTDGGPPDPAQWTSLVRRHGVTVWNSVPALLDMALHAGGPRDRLDSLRLVMLSGDWIPIGLPAQVREFAPDAVVAALGGATEAAIWSNIHLPGERPLPGWTSVPYGTPLANQGFHVLDGEAGHAPDWVPGDLVITGTGLARGYHNAPGQTAAAFRHHPVTGERMYVTGDRARYRPDGTLEFLGRADTQVKVRGHRIELAEVASVALALPGVRAAVADVLGERPDEQRLALFVACDPAERTGLAEKAAEAARETLPPYMVPADVVLLDALPVTANGKVDRGALRRSAGPATARRPEGRPPFPGTETVLAAIWEAVLGARVSDRAADFFALGGTSLLAARMVGRIETAFGVRPPLSGLFRHPTLAGQARLVEEADTYSARCTAVLRGEVGAPRLVLFHPVGGGLLCYRELVAALPGARHVIGVQSPPPAPGGGPGEGVRACAGEDGVSTLAARYAAELRTELGSGQAVFAGWSMGGVLALETARLLRGGPLDVTDVVAVDSYVAAAPGTFVHTGPAAERAFLADLHGGTHGGHPPRTASVPRELREPYHAYLANYRALLTHRPAEPDGIRVLAVRFRDSAPDGFAGLVPLTDHWSRVPPGVRVEELPGDHFAVTDPLRHGPLVDLLTPHRPATEPPAAPAAGEERGMS
ncbi:amino acid adenylation domain-containing protein [Streptomyces sp. NPDC051018]|uniref:amino acid adenylation domain-containing protein n=1 Tax=Streptomyces sp. NPDC051018 TaxID=3365639 RepID=UPI0037B4465B